MNRVNMDFSQALIQLRLGCKVARAGWYPTEFVVYQKGYPQGIGINANTAEATGIPEGTVCVFQPYLMKRSADGSFSPWTPNTMELLALDWEEV